MLRDQFVCDANAHVPIVRSLAPESRSFVTGLLRMAVEKSVARSPELGFSPVLVFGAVEGGAFGLGVDVEDVLAPQSD